MHEQRLTALLARVRDTLHNPGEAVAVGLGWAARRLFASFQHAFSMAIGKKTNPADRPSLADSPKCQSEVSAAGSMFRAQTMKPMKPMKPMKFISLKTGWCRALSPNV